MRRALAILAVLTAPACGGFVMFENEGSVCVAGTEWLEPEGDEPRMTIYEPHEPVTIHVVLEECAGGCAEDVSACCSVEREGDRLIVTASGSYREPSGPQACPAVCVSVDAECESDPLPPGSYTVEYAGQTTTFDVPDSRAPAMIGAGVCEFSG